MAVFVGLDCGGSTSRVMAVDAEGTILFQGQSGAANLASTDPVQLMRHLSQAVRDCPHADAVCGCFAGLVNHELKRQGEAILRDLFPGAVVRAEPDYAAALYAAPPGTDDCVIAGTGSLVCSRSESGEIRKSGGRGYLLGDEGSGFQVGRDALLCFLNDREGASDRLRKAVVEVFGTEDEAEIVAQVYRLGKAPGMLARLAKPWVAEAGSGEPHALASVEDQMSKLAGVVAQHGERHFRNQTELRISLVGGMWKAGRILAARFEVHLRGLLPSRDLLVARGTRPPLYGTIEMAKEIGIGNRS